MTQPPDEPPEGRPDEGWQAPGPLPENPYGGPPPGQQPGQPPGQDPGHGAPYDRPGTNPYGGPSSVYQPIDSGGMSRTVKIVLGVVIGVFAGFVLWFVAAISFAAGSTGSGNGFLFFAAVAPLLVPAPLLFFPATRPWAAGLLIGTAISSIGLSGLCSFMFSSFEGG